MEKVYAYTSEQEKFAEDICYRYGEVGMYGDGVKKSNNLVELLLKKLEAIGEGKGNDFFLISEADVALIASVKEMVLENQGKDAEVVHQGLLDAIQPLVLPNDLVSEIQQVNQISEAVEYLEATQKDPLEKLLDGIKQRIRVELFNQPAQEQDEKASTTKPSEDSLSIVKEYCSSPKKLNGFKAATDVEIQKIQGKLTKFQEETAGAIDKIRESQVIL